MIYIYIDDYQLKIVGDIIKSIEDNTDTEDKHDQELLS